MQNRDFALSLHGSQVHVMAKPFLQTGVDWTDQQFQWDQSFVVWFANLDEVRVRADSDLDARRALATRSHVPRRASLAQQCLREQNRGGGFADAVGTDE